MKQLLLEAPLKISCGRVPTRRASVPRGYQAAARRSLAMGNIIPTSGKDKKVLPADVFNAADTDKDGKLSVEELVKMLTKAGLALPNERMEMLVRAFDENGDGALDFGEFSNGLHHMMAVADAMLKEHHPSFHAVAAGVVSAGTDTKVDEQSARS